VELSLPENSLDEQKAEVKAIVVECIRRKQEEAEEKEESEEEEKVTKPKKKRKQKSSDGEDSGSSDSNKKKKKKKNDSEHDSSEGESKEKKKKASKAPKVKKEETKEEKKIAKLKKLVRMCGLKIGRMKGLSEEETIESLKKVLTDNGLDDKITQDKAKQFAKKLALKLELESLKTYPSFTTNNPRSARTTRSSASLKVKNAFAEIDKVLEANGEKVEDDDESGKESDDAKDKEESE